MDISVNKPILWHQQSPKCSLSKFNKVAKDLLVVISCKINGDDFNTMNILINEEYNDLSTLYWIPTLHRNTYRERYITSPYTEILLSSFG